MTLIHSADSEGPPGHYEEPSAACGAARGSLPHPDDQGRPSPGHTTPELPGRSGGATAQELCFLPPRQHPQFHRPKDAAVRVQ